MELPAVFFYLFAGMAIAFSILVVANKKPIASAFSLLMVFFCFAGLYAIMDAHLLAALQVLIYAGAVMVLFIFVIFLLNDSTPSKTVGRQFWFRLIAVLFCVLALGILVHAFRHHSVSPLAVPSGQFTPARVEAAGGNTRVLSELLFSEYILPFELTALLLFAAIVGSVSLAKRNRRKNNAC